MARIVKATPIPKPATAPKRPRAATASKATTSVAGASSLIDSLKDLAVIHGATLQTPPAEDIKPWATVELRASSPHSIERFVAAARAHPAVRDVQVLSSHIAVVIETTPEVAGK